MLGMMPHPERASEPELGMTDGAKVFHSLVSAMVAKQPSTHRKNPRETPLFTVDRENIEKISGL